MRRVICLFLDGVGLGSPDPEVNPLAAATLPTLRGLLDGAPLVAESGRVSTGLAHLIPTDACLGVAGRPQSASGQATILTGVNVPRALGHHYGPRPNASIRRLVDEANLFARLVRRGHSFCFCNAYPQGYFQAVARGKRLLSVIPYAALAAGQRLFTAADLRAGRALTADFTGETWRTHLGYTDTPIYTPQEAGRRLAAIAQGHSLTFFEHWMTDLLGHRRDRTAGVALLETFDAFLAGLLAEVDLTHTLVLVCSDHGNLEDCTERGHTTHPALTVLIGRDLRPLADGIHRLDDLAPAILAYLGRQIPAEARAPTKGQEESQPAAVQPF